MGGAGEDLSHFPGNAGAFPVKYSPYPIDRTVADFPNSDNFKYGFERPEMYKNPLAGTVDPYDRHVFLCYKNAESWPARIEDTEFYRLPRRLADAIESRKNKMHRRTRLTLCEGRNGTKFSNGDVLIFPDMVRCRSLTQLVVDHFVEEVLVKGETWGYGAPVTLKGSYVFVCAHGSRDQRCGVCGPDLVDKFRVEIELRGLQDEVFVSKCSHIGGHKYAGNLIIFKLNSAGKCEGNWYGYVTPDDVPILLDHHIGKGEIIRRLWRGQMGSSNVERKLMGKQKHQENDGMAHLNVTNLEKGDKEPQGSSTIGNMKDGTSCCQDANGFSCCKDAKLEVNNKISEKKQRDGINVYPKKGSGGVAAWVETWEQGDVLAAIAVIGAMASVAVAYIIYRRSG